MEDIKINTPFMKIQYVVSWFGFIFFGFLLVWLIALGLHTYGKDTPDNKKKKKGVLNMTYQKFIFVFGVITADFIIAAFILGMLLNFIGF